MTTQTVFRIASISKGLTGLAALKLQEQGKLKLTDTLRQWAPEHAVENAWEATDPVRLVHLLEHTSGLPDSRFSEYAHNDPTPATLAQSLAFAPHYRVTRWRPGSRHAYSNVGHALAAAIIEKASGQRFEDYVHDNIFVPLGMTSTSYFLTPEQRANSTTMYWSGNGQPAPYTNPIYRASSSVTASIEDMANYVRFHLQRGRLDERQVLQPASMDRLEVPGSLPAVHAGVTTGYGLGNTAFFDRGYEWHGHDGYIDAALSSMAYCPELDLGVVILINSNNGHTFHQIKRSVRRYMMRGIPETSRPPSLPIAQTLQESLPGYYLNISPRNEGFKDFAEYLRNVRVLRADEQGITFGSPFLRRPSRWLAVSDRLFRHETASKPGLAVLTGENGEVLLQNDHGTFQRTWPAGFWIVIFGMLTSVVLLISAVLFAVVWGTRKAFGRLKNAGPLSLRLWPLVGAAGLFGFITFYVNVQEGWGPVIGTRNAWTMGVMLMTLLVPLSAIASTVTVWRNRRTPMNRVAYWHAVVVTCALLFVTGFFWSWELIGIRLWA
jgi:CubicO group peptidase (beta-lactamase class C family)